MVVIFKIFIFWVQYKRKIENTGSWLHKCGCFVSDAKRQAKQEKRLLLAFLQQTTALLIDDFVDMADDVTTSLFGGARTKNIQHSSSLMPLPSIRAYIITVGRYQPISRE